MHTIDTLTTANDPRHPKSASHLRLEGDRPRSQPPPKLQRDSDLEHCVYITILSSMSRFVTTLKPAMSSGFHHPTVCQYQEHHHSDQDLPPRRATFDIGSASLRIQSGRQFLSRTSSLTSAALLPILVIRPARAELPSIGVIGDTHRRTVFRSIDSYSFSRSTHMHICQL